MARTRLVSRKIARSDHLNAYEKTDGYCEGENIDRANLFVTVSGSAPLSSWTICRTNTKFGVMGILDT